MFQAGILLQQQEGAGAGLMGHALGWRGECSRAEVSGGRGFIPRGGKRAQTEGRQDPRTKAARCQVQTQTQCFGFSSSMASPTGTQLRKAKNDKVSGRPAGEQAIGVRRAVCAPAAVPSLTDTSLQMRSSGSG